MGAPGAADAHESQGGFIRLVVHARLRLAMSRGFRCPDNAMGTCPSLGVLRPLAAQAAVQPPSTGSIRRRYTGARRRTQQQHHGGHAIHGNEASGSGAGRSSQVTCRCRFFGNPLLRG